jgi:alkylation response protein AidB-like acyl-CoA dehydrogenase
VVNFDLDDEQRLLDETLRRYFRSEFPAGAVRAAFESPTLAAEQTPWGDLAAMGVFAMAIPEEYGGAGRGLVDLAVAAECLGFAAAPGPFLEHALATIAIVVGGDDEQRARWLPSLGSGAARATVAVAEPGDRWDAEALAMGGAVLRGTKSWVLAAEGADLVVVVLHDGLALLSPDAPGVELQPIDALDATRRSWTLVLDAPAHERLRGRGDAARCVLDAGAVLLAADAFGGAQRCLRASVDYARQREQFGVTIAHFQAIKHQLADMALEVEPARGLYWYAAHAFDRVPEDASRFASLAKAHITDRYLAAARRAIEIHGGIGYTWECDLHLYLRRAVADRALLGAPRYHHERFAALAGWQELAAG